MIVRPLNQYDYDSTLVGWWKQWKQTPPPIELLPDNGIGGFIVLDGKIPVCAGFVYITNSSMVWMEFIVSNINYKNKKNRIECLKLLESTISSFAFQLGKKYVYSLLKTSNKSLLDISASQGYVHNGERFNEMIKVLWEQ